MSDNPARNDLAQTLLISLRIEAYVTLADYEAIENALVARGIVGGVTPGDAILAKALVNARQRREEVRAVLEAVTAKEPT